MQKHEIRTKNNDTNGKDFRSEKAIDSNLWEHPDNLKKVVDWIDEENEWSWIRNSECKYISLRIDMRDGAFIIKNRDGKRITFDQLKAQ